MAESLERGKIGEEAKQREYFQIIAHECRRLSSLVDNVLDFSRIDQGGKRYRFEPVAIGPLARQAVALMEPCAADRQVKLVLNVAAGMEKLEPRWDGGAVEQCLLNLLDNAVKHAPPLTEVMLAVEARGPVRFHVTDRGPGIPLEAQNRIFELFYRHGPELRPETKGAGIGLAIVKHVAEAHGGRVTVESRVGEGSRFTLELPLVPPSEAE
jgi:two-component system phosphate regulon sensor histidine kinase PhoR